MLRRFYHSFGKMANEDHLNLSNFIKSVHEQLRRNTKIYGEDNAWNQHCDNNDILQKYSSAMQKLSINYWENNYKQNNKAISRISWIYNYCKQYFLDGLLLIEHRQKELEIAKKINLEIENQILDDNRERTLNVLDVGSCYNPFKKYKNFNVIPIDIAPATQDVYKCDFLNLNLSSEHYEITTTTTKEIQQLTINSFDIIIFSLLLEYLPTANQRLLCCKKAYNLLKFEGILIIITPDSKHINANSKIIKSWRYILAKLGFSRIKYDKLPHLHCMVFRKCLMKEITVRWTVLKDSQQFLHEMVIPQDFNKSNDTNDNCSKFDDCDVELFEELPFS